MDTRSMLDIYIYDYLMRRNLNASALIFQAEAQFCNEGPAIHSPEGFLSEWWSVFWDIFRDRYKTSSPGISGSYNQSESQVEVMPVQKQKQELQQSARLQLLQQLKSSHQQHPQGPQSSRKPQLQRQSSQQLLMQQTQQQQVILQTQEEQIPQNDKVASSQGVTDLVMNLGSTKCPQPLLGIAASNLGVNNLPLTGWPLMGLDQLQPHLIPQQKPLNISSQTSLQLQLQQQIRMHHNVQDMSASKDGQSAGEVSQCDGFVEDGVSRKRKKPIPSSGPTKSSGTSTAAKSTGGQQESASSTPSAHTTSGNKGPLVPRDDNSSQIYDLGHDIVGRLASADANHCANIGILEKNLVSHETQHAGDKVLPGSSSTIDFTFSEIGQFDGCQVECCDFSSNGELIATGARHGKIAIWGTDRREKQSILGEHSNGITDIRFGPRSSWIATSSFDRSVRVWDIDNPCYSIRNFMGHSAAVSSVDFHPKNDDLVCSSDDSSSIRYWSIKNNCCVGVSKGGATQVRFQPTWGRYVAAAVGNSVSLVDVETTQTSTYTVKGHASKVRSICWNSSGEYLASLSEDLIRVWKIGSGGVQICMHELSITGKKFCRCIFHPRYPFLLVIGLCQSLEVWNMAENKMLTVLDHPTAVLAAEQHAGLMATANDNLVKLWK